MNELRTLTEEQKGVLETYFKKTKQIKIDGFSKETSLEIIKEANAMKKSLFALNDYETLIDDSERYLEELLMKDDEE